MKRALAFTACFAAIGFFSLMWLVGIDGGDCSSSVTTEALACEQARNHYLIIWMCSTISVVGLLVWLSFSRNWKKRN